MDRSRNIKDSGTFSIADRHRTSDVFVTIDGNLSEKVSGVKAAWFLFEGTDIAVDLFGFAAE